MNNHGAAKDRYSTKCLRLEHTYTHNRLTAFGPGQPGYAGNRRNTHPLTPILIIGHPLSNSSIYNDQWHPLCSFYVLEAGTGLK